METVNTNLYSRQIKAYGMETMEDLSKLTILIIGMRGLGLETAKNIILTGPKEVNIFDPNKCSIRDLGSNYYINESDVKEEKRRDQACLKELRTLNPHVNVSIMEGDNILKNLKKYNLIVISEMIDENNLIKIDEECRNNHIGFIYSCALGISGFIFSDFGTNFIIKDFNGVENKYYMIQNITNEKQGKITIDDKVGSNNEFNLFSNSMVILSDIKGMEELNDDKPKEFIKIDKHSFYIKEDTTHYGKYIKGGMVNQYKKPIVNNYKSLKERIEIPFEEETFINPIDSTKKNQNPILHCGFMGIQKYFSKYGKLPELNDLDECKKIIEIAKEIYNKSKEKNEEWTENVKEFNEKIVENISRWSKAEIIPICSIIGGMLAQEIVKFTGKYNPINQWIWFDFFETISLLDENIERKLQGTRYDDFISIYGNEIQKKLENLNIFMIGAGANGCEFLKNFSLMGISCLKGKITVSDNDLVEVSNLNRQFLYRNENIGDFKSKIACENVKKFNPNINIKDFQLMVCEDTENVFNEDFWNKQDLIIFAVDSDEARNYIDNQCTNYKLTGIDAGTLGTKGRVTLIVPDKTICLRERTKEKKNEISVPMCTLHHFPNTINHCLEYAKIKFLEVINESIKNMKDYLSQIDNHSNEKNNKEFLIEEINLFFDFINLIKIKNPIELLGFCVKLFIKYFDNDIQKILFLYPKDLLNKDGTLFWSGSKRIPHPIKYDINNELCFMFVKNYSFLLSKLFNINIDESTIKKDLQNIDVNHIIENFKIKEKKEIELELDKLNLNLDIKNEIDSIVPIEFDKEDDVQIRIIHSFANLRANNFEIKNSSFITSKFLLGKIVPSIPTSTASIGGFVCMQILNLIQSHDLSILRNTIFNFATPFIIQLKPEEVKHHIDGEIDPILNESIRVVPNKWTIWDKIQINESKTCKELIELIKFQYNVDINLISSDSFIIYNSRSKKGKIDINKKIEDIYKIQNIKKTNKIIWLNAFGKLDKKTTIMPKIRYKYY